MKISKRLQRQIDSLIRDEMTEATNYIESFFRSDDISHDVWIKMHARLIKAGESIRSGIGRSIDHYDRGSSVNQ